MRKLIRILLGITSAILVAISIIDSNLFIVILAVYVLLASIAIKN